jgi:multiple sugar transport system permease protein
MPHKKRPLTPFILLAPSLALLVFLVAYPIGFSLFYSFHAWDLARGPEPQGFVGLANYITLVTDPHFQNAIWVTMKFAFTAVGIQVLAGMGAALLFNKPLRGIGVMRSLLILPTAVAPIISALLFRYMYYQALGTGIIPWALAQIGIKTPAKGILGDTSTALLGVIMTDVWIWTPFFIIAYIAGLQSVPIEQLEAAKVDGAGPLQIFRYVTLPHMRRLIAIVFIIFFMQEFNVFDIIFALTHGGPGETTTTLSFYLYRQGLEYYNIGYAAALTWVIALIILVIVNIYFYFAFRGVKV